MIRSLVDVAPSESHAGGSDRRSAADLGRRVKLYGSDLKRLEYFGDQLVSVMNKVRGVADLGIFRVAVARETAEDENRTLPICPGFAEPFNLASSAYPRVR